MIGTCGSGVRLFYSSCFRANMMCELAADSVCDLSDALTPFSLATHTHMRTHARTHTHTHTHTLSPTPSQEVGGPSSQHSQAGTAPHSALPWGVN